MLLTKRWFSFVTLLVLFLQDAFAFHAHENKHSQQIFENGISTRRKVLGAIWFVPMALGSSGLSFSSPANAIAMFPKKDRRQLELCIVNILRLQYWSMNIAYILENSETEEEQKKKYLEARLGAKAMVAEKQKIGGGATGQVFALKGLQIKDCLDDLKYYSKTKKMDQYTEDLVESLASIVEFDGLETTQDPSPRSSLTLSQYNGVKAVFVRRMLTERVTPLTRDIVTLFGRDTQLQCEAYIQQYYPNELPPKPGARNEKLYKVDNPSAYSE